MSLTPMSWTRRANAIPGGSSFRKWPWIRGVRAPRRLAGALLASAVMLSGCLLPQDDYVLPGQPQFLNRAPRFIEALIQPDRPYVATNNNSSLPSTPCPLDFTVAAEDEDVADILRVRFYVDYDENTHPWYERELEFPVTGTAQRGTLTWTTDVAWSANPLVEIGPHNVEALLFDGSLGPNREPDPKNVSDAGVNPSYVVIHQWVVQTSSGLCQ